MHAFTLYQHTENRGRPSKIGLNDDFIISQSKRSRVSSLGNSLTSRGTPSFLSVHCRHVGLSFEAGPPKMASAISGTKDDKNQD